MADKALVQALEAEAAHAAVEAFLLALERGRESRGLPESTLLELAGTDHTHWALLFGPGNEPIAVKTTVLFTQDVQVIRTILTKYKQGVAEAIPRRLGRLGPATNGGGGESR